MKKPRVVVTGLGVISSIGFGWQDFWDSLLQGKSGIKRISSFDLAEYPTTYGGEISNFDPLQFMCRSDRDKFGRGSQFAIAASKLAFEDARIQSKKLVGRNIGVCLGTTMADIQALEKIDEMWVKRGEEEVPRRLIGQYPSFTISANIGNQFGLCGPNMMIPTACAAGNHAISYAADIVRSGEVDGMLAGGVDPFSRIAFTGFNRIFAIAPEKCQPFDKNRKGTLIGEGAGILYLETLESAVGRGASIYAEVAGYALTCDAHHMTIPSVNGLTSVMERALSDAEISSDEVDYISAHGTGTIANDRTESSAIRAVFKDRAETLPVSSIKSMLGHTMGAASALEAIACALVISRDTIPPTVNHETMDPECIADCVPNIARKQLTKVVLNNSFAFGGNNVCVVFKKISNLS